MSWNHLLTWIRLGQLEDSVPQDVLAMVDAALDELDEEDPRFAALLPVEQELMADRVPVDLLLGLVQDFASPANPEEEAVDRLEREYREAAAAFTEPQWRSAHYAELERHLEEADDEELLRYLDALRERITSAWQRYAEDLARVETRSPEIEVGHRLMREAHEAWMTALETIAEGGDCEEGLRLAEQAVRLLAAVGRLDRDVKQQAAAVQSTFRPPY